MTFGKCGTRVAGTGQDRIISCELGVSICQLSTNGSIRRASTTPKLRLQWWYSARANQEADLSSLLARYVPTGVIIQPKFAGTKLYGGASLVPQI